MYLPPRGPHRIHDGGVQQRVSLAAERGGARLFQDSQHGVERWREPAGRDEDRYYGTFTLRPTRRTVVRAWVEDATIDATTPRNVRK